MQQWFDALLLAGEVLNLATALTDLVTALLEDRRRRRTMDS